MLKRCAAFLFLVFAAFAAVRAEEKTYDFASLPAEEFLRCVRRAPSGETWALMSGTATHRRSGARAIQDSIRIGMRFTPQRILAQLTFAGNEQYELGQTFTEPPVFTQEVRAPDPEKTRLSLYGVAASDLTLGFLYRKLIREEKPDSVKTVSCRVFLLDGGNDDYVRVWISDEYLFPLKAHWFKTLPEESGGEPYRELELGGFRKENDYYVVKELLLFGPDWRTRIEFDRTDAGSASEKAPADLFLDEPDAGGAS